MAAVNLVNLRDLLGLFEAHPVLCESTRATPADRAGNQDIQTSRFRDSHLGGKTEQCSEMRVNGGRKW